ncbi:MAG: DEAD/DEAH box helicase [Labilithrix sp.]|nr:DEAD/DEAH box helicase [Labilithrix sp.]MCW5814162.1 DEAD/DEAH box helicase [Labilithrix sp.]
MGWDDLRAPASLREAIAAPGRHVFAAVVVSASMMPLGRRRGVRVVLRDGGDETCKLHAFWFFTAHGVLAVAKPGAKLIVVGKVVVEPPPSKKPPRTAHPDLFPDAPETRVVRPRYPRLGPKGAILRKAIATAATVDADPLPAAIAAREGMPPAEEVLRRMHALGGDAPADADRRAFVERLAWAEAFTKAWERLDAEEGLAGKRAPALPPAAATVKKLERALGFAFTKDQREAIATVAADLASDRPMRRLLLGDVGTGKTAVALAAVAQAVKAGKQAAILAPTTVLAEQYMAAVRPLEAATGARAVLVSAGATERREGERALARREAAVAIGTHALLGAGVALPDLALVVVDEQQRLGVGQRLALVHKGARERTRPHLLTLSATPIPRTFALALRGELATTTLRERPAGRPPVATALAPRSAEAAVVRLVEETTLRGERVFWVVPRIEDTGEDEDTDELASLEARALALKLAVKGVGVIHGRMKPAEKRAAMQAFRDGETPLLVGTTVIEVGVDVPEATLIVIEDAQQFGLAQLHQLRGRVGRGSIAGACVLLHEEPLEGLARARLERLAALSSGEEVAKADLELRGSGDLGGTRQHGEEEELVYLDPADPWPWLERVESDARAIRAADKKLAAPEHRVLGSIVAKLRRALAVREEAG